MPQVRGRFPFGPDSDYGDPDIPGLDPDEPGLAPDEPGTSDTIAPTVKAEFNGWHLVDESAVELHGYSCENPNAHTIGNYAEKKANGDIILNLTDVIDMFEDNQGIEGFIFYTSNKFYDCQMTDISDEWKVNIGSNYESNTVYGIYISAYDKAGNQSWSSIGVEFGV